MKIAVITGASSGIGRAFCHKLDNEGLDEIWAIATTEQKLATLQGECKTKIVTFALDLTNPESFEIYKTKLKEKKPNITWLVNCSGFGKFGRYDEIDTEISTNMIDLNCKGTVRMNEYSLPFMHENARIVNIASVAGWQPVPFINVYAATKAFVISYSRSLNVELKPRKISVTAICPFWTKTNFFKRATSKEKEQVVSKYAVMYDPEFVINKAYKAALKRKDLAVIGTKSKFTCFLSKVLSHKFVLKYWVKQQNLDKKYGTIPAKNEVLLEEVKPKTKTAKKTKK